MKSLFSYFFFEGIWAADVRRLFRYRKYVVLNILQLSLNCNIYNRKGNPKKGVLSNFTSNQVKSLNCNICNRKGNPKKGF